MKPFAAAAAILLALASCKGSGDQDDPDAIFRAPKASTGSGIDPDTQGAIEEQSEIRDARAEMPKPPNVEYKEITVDPKDGSSKFNLARTILGEEWVFVSKTLKSGGVAVWKFMRRDAGRVDADAFGLPDIPRNPKNPIQNPLDKKKIP